MPWDMLPMSTETPPVGNHDKMLCDRNAERYQDRRGKITSRRAQRARGRSMGTT